MRSIFAAVLGFIGEGIRFRGGQPFRSGPILSQELAQTPPCLLSRLVGADHDCTSIPLFSL
jgi:hypothetical protein